MKWPPFQLPQRLLPQRGKTDGSLLGLAFDDSRMEGAELRRTNGSVEVRHSFAAALSLDLLNGEPELVGREIRKHLEAAGIRERRCVACVPISWALTVGVHLPPQIASEDLESLLQVEAERGFPSGVDTLVVARSECAMPSGERYVTLMGVPRPHVARLEQVLAAAQLTPVSFSIGVAALQPAGSASDGILALLPGAHAVSLQVTCGGGIAMLRSVASSAEADGTEPGPNLDLLAREIRITLGQLPADVRETLRRVRVFGKGEAAEGLTRELRSRFGAAGLEVQQVSQHEPEEFGVRLPGAVPVSPALSLAVRRLARGTPGPEFLPPKVSAWRQFSDRYASRKLAWTGAAAGVLAVLLALTFGIQQLLLMHWQGRWDGMRDAVTELNAVQQQIRTFRPWYDETFRSLAVLRRLAEAFPEDGSVTAKSVEIREKRGITCSGTARDQKALLQALDRLRNAPEVRSVNTDQMRGQAPIQFTFNFRWREAGTP